MHFRGHDFHVVQAYRAQLFGHPFGGALDVRLVLGLRADAGNAQEFVQLVQVFVVFGIDVFGQVHVPSFGGAGLEEQVQPAAWQTK